MRRLLALGAVLLVLGLAVLLVPLTSKPARPPRCLAGRYQLDPDQAANAATVTLVGLRQGLPDHAVTVALATALQESRLRNLPYGDRDSVGLFQQRPSQGWGSRAELLRPSFAAAAFYRRLRQVPGWETLPVTAAAQAVQLSGAPYAYGQWADEARVLARAFTGEVPAGLACAVPVTGHPLPQQVGERVAAAFGQPLLGVPVSGRRGWQVCSWLVANAAAVQVRLVQFAGRTWSDGTGWSAGPPGDTIQVG